MNETEFEGYLAAEGYGKTGHSEYAVDMDNAEHTHDFGFAAMVISGEFHLVTPEGEKTLGPGDVWSLDAGVPHSEKVLGNEPVAFIYGIKG